MKSFIRILLFGLLLALFSGCNDGNSVEYILQPSPEIEAAKTVVMVYFYGTNLESDGGAATGNILRMMEANYSENLKVVIQTGAGEIKYNDDANAAMFDDNEYAVLSRQEREKLPVQDWTRVQRYEVSHNNAALLEDVGESCLEDVKDGCIDMGLPNRLTEFINFTEKNYSADRYILVLWNHGGGPILGYGGDSERASVLSVQQIAAALKDSSIEQFEILGFDACLMASAEVVHSFRNLAKVFIGSQEVEPSGGWDYKGFLDLLSTEPDVSAFKIGKEIANNFIAYNKTDDDGEFNDLTLSVTDLTAQNTENIVKAVDDISLQLLNAFNADKQKTWVDIFSARSLAREYYYPIIDDNSYNLVDLYDFFEKISVNFNGSVSSDMVEAAVLKAVDYSTASTSYQEGTHGLSLWVPYHFNEETANDLDDYKSLYSSTGGSGHNDFSQNYISLLEALINHYYSQPQIFKFDSLPFQLGSTVVLTVESNFGIEDAVLIADIDADEDGIQAATSVIASVKRTEEPFVYEIEAEATDHVFAYTDDDEGEIYPLFMDFIRASGTKYYFTLPVYFQSADDEAGVPYEFGYLDFMYDSMLKEGELDTTFYPDDYMGKDEIYLKAGDKLQLADTFIDYDGEVEYFESGKVITLSEESDGGYNLDIDLVPSPDPATVYAFNVQNLANKVILSPFFDEDGVIQP